MKNSEKITPGKLYMVGTPIGNLGDMSSRAVEILSTVDVIAAEDTRNSIKLLNHFGIHTPMVAYHDHNRYEEAEVLVKRILNGERVACITDAGNPGISDPGEEFVRIAVENGIEVTSVPGPSAFVAALLLSGLSTRRFRFEGFLPTDKKEKDALYSELKEDTATLLFHEAPHRLKETLYEFENVFGDRRIAVCKELTKLHENILRATISEAAAYYEGNEPKGEYVLVVEGKSAEDKKKEKQAAWEKMSIEEHLAFYMEKGFEKKEAMKKVAEDRGIPKREVYQAVMKK